MSIGQNTVCGQGHWLYCLLLISLFMDHIAIVKIRSLCREIAIFVKALSRGQNSTRPLVIMSEI